MAHKEKNAHVFERADNEWYVDSPSCAAALFDTQPFDGAIYDPCAGMGNILRAASAAGYEVRGSDIAPRPAFYSDIPGVLIEEPRDFLRDNGEWEWVDNIVMNPPYGRSDDGRIEERFIDRALDVSNGKVAALLRLQWIVAREDYLRERGWIRTWLLTPRPSMLPGENIMAGEMPRGGAVDYAWVVFLHGFDGMATVGHARRKNDLDSVESWFWRLGAR